MPFIWPFCFVLAHLLPYKPFSYIISKNVRLFNSKWDIFFVRGTKIAGESSNRVVKFCLHKHKEGDRQHEKRNEYGFSVSHATGKFWRGGADRDLQNRDIGRALSGAGGGATASAGTDERNGKWVSVGRGGYTRAGSDNDCASAGRNSRRTGKSVCGRSGTLGAGHRCLCGGKWLCQRRKRNSVWAGTRCDRTGIYRHAVAGIRLCGGIGYCLWNGRCVGYAAQQLQQSGGGTGGLCADSQRFGEYLQWCAAGKNSGRWSGDGCADCKRRVYRRTVENGYDTRREFEKHRLCLENERTNAAGWKLYVFTTKH